MKSLQKGIVRMLKTEQILIMSRDFDKRPNGKIMKKIIKFVNEEVSLAPSLLFALRISLSETKN